MLIGTGSKKYVDWLPYEHTIELAQLYFQGGRPFEKLDTSQQQRLFKCTTIRNVIAHKSRSSIQKFDEHILGSNPLQPQERTPAGYVRGVFRISPMQTRYENIVAQLLIIAHFLAT